jgi:hypothetical protein
VSSDAVDVRPFRDGDEAELVGPVDRRPESERSLDEWAWRYPPVAGGRPIVVAIRGESRVGWLGAVARRLRVDGLTLDAAAVVDASVPGVEEGRPVQSDVLGLLVRGFEREFGPGRRFELIFHVTEDHREESVSVALPGSSTATAELCRLTRHDPPRRTIRRLAYRAEPARDWEPRLDGLWRRSHAAYPAAVVRDADYALGRHAGHPTRRCHRFVVMPRFSSAAVAWVVFEIRGRECWWTDLVWDHDHPEALGLVAHLSARLARQAGARSEVIFTAGDSRLRRLQELGFSSEATDREARVTVLVSSRAHSAAEIARDMYLTIADLEHE